ncbi:hypothetical protein BU23DRAFT_627307 [Bimuria novae-zelandiae CBS 107.79]|uniref:Uncharacterized protein n=1 Tax=Bimuria novae-zelandiae CBS 107.79 TaxID=1447943 RepID=A0A6A5ULF1_9PLEO|nr:hypothetical protein BU23DRAFT_627307 [Bimuria novae-zelandiae CBS 107.79]
MRISAPADLESGSSASTILSACSPPAPLRQATPKPHIHNAHVRKPRRVFIRRNRSADTAVKVPAPRPESPPRASSLPRPTLGIPKTSVQRRAPRTPCGLLPRRKDSGVKQPSPGEEWRRALPRLYEIPKINIIPATPEEPPLPTWRKPPRTQPLLTSPAPRERDPSGFSRKPARTSRTKRKPPLGDGQPGPIFHPFLPTHLSRTCKLSLAKTAEHPIDLRECWRCPEAELKHGGGDNTQSVHNEERSSERPEADEETERTPLLASSPEASVSGTEDEPHFEAAPRRTIFQRVISFFLKPFVTIYTHIVTTVKEYMHDKKVQSGELGSYDTETAHWLRRSSDVENWCVVGRRAWEYGMFASSPPAVPSQRGSSIEERSMSRESVEGEVRNVTC